MKKANTYNSIRNLVTALAVITVTGALAADEPRVFTVDNTGGPHADFTDLQEAMDAAEDGDVFHVLGSPIEYGDIVVTRQVDLFGPGYNLARVHDEGYQDFYEARIGSVDFTAREEVVNGASLQVFSSGGSSISGFHIRRSITIRTNDVTVQRNYVDDTFRSNTVTIGSEIFRPHRARILRNYIRSSSAIFLNSGGMENTVANNITTGHASIENAVVRNNVFTRTQTASSFRHSTVENNIIGRVNSSSTDQCILNNNVFFSERPDDEDDFFIDNAVSNNQWEIAEILVFTGTGAFDEAFQLSETSPARGAGVNGVDVGAFDGPFPYEISGVPPLPRVKIMAPGPFTVSPNSDLTIPVKIEVE